jgi:hypothetical protein
VCPDVYHWSGAPEPEDHFEPGELRHLVAGNRGRLLDPRRTPVTVTAVTLLDGTFEVRIDAFEDAGASWRVPLEDVSRYQFAAGEQRASAESIERLQEAESRLNVPLRIDVDPVRRAASIARVQEEAESAGRWLESLLTGELDLQARVRERVGEELLMELLERFLRERELMEIETAFIRAFVSNPSAGELVRGHAIVLAELGLCPYDGKIIREGAAMAGALSRERRAEHLMCRLAFSRALWSRIGAGAVIYRAYSSEGELRAPAPASFLSVTLSREVALSHFGGGPATRASAIWRSPLDPGRVLMSFLETRAMSEHYREAEVVLIGGRGP